MLIVTVQMLEEVDSHQSQMADVAAVHAPNWDPLIQLADSPLLRQKTNQLETKKNT